MEYYSPLQYYMQLTAPLYEMTADVQLGILLVDKWFVEQLALLINLGEADTKESYIYVVSLSGAALANTEETKKASDRLTRQTRLVILKISFLPLFLPIALCIFMHTLLSQLKSIFLLFNGLDVAEHTHS